MRKIKYSLFLILLSLTCLVKAQQDPVPDFYPLEVGDFIEYKTYSYEVGSQTIYREVMSDTILPNGLTYKIVKLCSCNGTLNLEPTYTIERKGENGKIYIYYDNEDVLLYDFNLESGTIYPSPYGNLSWQIVQVDMETISMILMDEKENWVQYINFKKEIGPIYYSNIVIDELVFEYGVDYWASIINGVRKGKLFSIKDTFLSHQYYPLNTGDIFVYKDGTFFITPPEWGYIIKRVLEDTTLIDGLKYKKVKYELINVPNLYPDFSYERIDESGVYVSNGYKSEFLLQSNFCIGDTFYSNIFYETYNEPWTVMQKNESYVDYQMLTSANQSGEVWFFNNLGVLGYGSNSLARGGSLVGAVINGELWGDTSTVITSVDDDNPLSSYNLSQNYPNPFNPTTQINYSLQESNFVTLKVYNSIGELVSTLVNEEKPAGNYSLTFNASGLPSGVYFYRLTSGSFNQTRKMILLR